MSDGLVALAAAYDGGTLVIIDGHNDLALRRWRGEAPRHLTLEHAAEVGFAGGFFALFVPGAPTAFPAEVPYAMPLPPPVPHEQAAALAEELYAAFLALGLHTVRSVEEFVPGRVGAILHLEGAEPLAPDLGELHAWLARGLRSIGLTWSRANAFAEGVPFAFPGSPDSGPGLSEAGVRLVHACNLHGIVVDLSHLNAAGFWDVARASEAPLVATHSNAHTLCQSTRNLDDAQLDAIGASAGMVGVNFAVNFLRADGREDSATPLAEIVRHVDYLVGRIGIDHVGFGSDFEGAVVPDELGGMRGLPALVAALGVHGYDEEEVAKLTHLNWLRVLDESWRPWRTYLARAGADPRPTLLDALARFAEPGFAVDLGAGAGRDSAELLRQGWSVLALDAEPEALERLHALLGPDTPRLSTRQVRFEDAELPPCDLVNASFALPFCPPGAFAGLWSRIVSALRPGGRFSGQLFGARDDWAGAAISVVRRDELEALLAPFAVERIDELEHDGATVTGTPKHWHVFHVVARKR